MLLFDIMNTKPTDLAYTAGYIDGDGCFFLGKVYSPRTHIQKYTISIIISSVNRYVLDVFKRQYGGSVRMTKEEHDNRKSLFQWHLGKIDCTPLAQQLITYLVEKKQECLLMLKSIESTNDEEKEQLIQQIRIEKDVGNLVSRYHRDEFNKLKNTIEPTENDFAYLAGFIDAECCFYVQVSKPKYRPNKTYKIMLQCNNTKAPAFKWLIQRFGGNITFMNRVNTQKARKNQLCWRLSGKSLSLILDRVYPFLKHKQPVCKQLIDLYAISLQNGGARHTEEFRTGYAALLRLKEHIVSNVKKLNQKGIQNI